MAAATSAELQQHRNIIFIPMDIYRKCTESSSSDSSSLPSARWHSQRGRTQVDRIMSSRQAKAKASSSHSSRPQTRAKQRQQQLHLKVTSPQHFPLQHPSTLRSPYHLHRHGHFPVSPSFRPTDVDLLAASTPPTSINFPPTPTSSEASLSSSLSSLSSSSSSSSPSPSSLLPSSSRTRAPSNKIIHKNKNNNNAVTVGGTMATIHLRSLNMVPPKKRKLSAVGPMSESTAIAPLSAGPDVKRLKIKLNIKNVPQPPLQPPPVMAPEKTAPGGARTVREVIVISDDEDEDMVQAAPTMITMPILTTTHTSTAITAPSSTVLSSARTTLASGSGPAPPAHESTSHKYELNCHLRHVVDTVFPSHEASCQPILERAFATCRKLRDDYIVDRYLGSGCSGFVLAAKRVADGKQVAIKVIPHTGDHVEHKVRRELDILVSVKSHENILEFVEYFTSSLYGDVDPEDQSNTDIYYIVTEMGGYSLFDFIELHKPSQEDDPTAKQALEIQQAQGSPAAVYGSAIQDSVLRSIFTQLALALHSLHSQSVVHGDIKDENALINVDTVSNTYRAKLCDFGHSKHLKPNSPPTFSFYGTTILAPPEMDANVALRAKGRDPNRRDRKRPDDTGATAAPAINLASPRWDHFYGYEADVWAMGLMLYTMIHGDLPSELYDTDPKREAAYKKKRRSSRSFPFTIQEDLDADLKDLLKRMLAVDPSRRLTMSQVINHKWMTKDSQ